MFDVVEKAKKLFIFVVLVAWSFSSFAGDIYLQLDKDSGYLGKYLTGIHFVYCNEKDAIYKDDSIAKWARKAGVSTARFPGGGIIKYWDWKNPTGIKNVDSWDKGTFTQVDPSQWMSMDEYLHFVDVSGITPLIGINLLSGVRNNRVDDSIKRAVEEVKYVVSKGHKGAFYYLGNEDMGKMGGIEGGAKIFLAHAKAIKQVDPSAKLFWNDNLLNEARMQQFLDIAGEYADGVEFHGKWPYGGIKFNHNVTLADWQQQFPFVDEKRGSYSDRALALRAYAKQLGYPNLMFANNEYGLAHKKDRYIGFNRFDFGLVAIEFLQDLYIGKFDMAAFWSNVSANNNERPDSEGQTLIDTALGNRLNPVHFGFELLSSAQGKKLVKIEQGDPGGYGFAALSDDTLEIFLLNKTNVSSKINIKIEGDKKINSEGKIVSMIDTTDHWGALKKDSIQLQDRFLKVSLPALSYSKIVLSFTADNKH